jgi:choline kinase
MRAVILAAGRGGRLRDVTGNRPKCLARVGDCTLIERQLRTLRRCRVDDIIVVTGYQAGEVRRVCGAGVRFVHNARYAGTNSLYSLWLARHLLRGGFLVLNCDVLFHPQLLVDLLTARYEDALLMSARGDTPYSDEEMKLRVRRGVVVEVAKTVPPDDADGENIGIAKFGADGAAAVVDEMTALIAAGATGEWLPAAFNRFCRRRPLHVVDHRGYAWIEIDFPEDHRRACAEVLPAVDDEDEAPERPRERAIPDPLWSTPRYV